MWERRGGEVPEAWYRLPIFYFSNVSEIRGPDDPVWAPAAFERARLRAGGRGARSTRRPSTSPPERAEEAIGGYTIFNDWSARDLQREETVVRLGPAKGKDFASSFGPWLVTPDELADARSGTGYDLAMTAEVNGTETSRGRWSDAQFSFGEMLARASADVRLRPGRPDRQRHGRHRLPARGPRRDARPLSRARRRGRPDARRIERLGAISPNARSIARPPVAERGSGGHGRRSAIRRQHRADDRRRLARGPAHLRRGHRDRRRDARARGPRLEPFRPLAPGRVPARGTRPARVEPSSAGPRLAATRRGRVYSGVAWESVYVAADARGQGSVERCSRP